MKRVWLIASLVLVAAMLFSACQPAPATTAPMPADTTAPAAPAEKFIFGMLLVGPYNDKGYSQATYEGAEYVKANMENVDFVFADKVNNADRPGTTPEQLAEDLVSKGAKLVIFNSDDMKDGAVNFAKAHPDVPVIHLSGDTSWKDGKNYVELPLFGNSFGRMEYGKMLAGCAAALTTKSGQIGYLGPLINDETRRLAASAYLGAKYCFEKYAGKDPATLKFKVTWIGFWFNIPGFTSDPTQVADDFLNTGHDVVISGIDTTEALVQAGKAKAAGKDAWGIAYDYVKACEEGKDVCLGVPYFNWGPVIKKQVENVKDGKFASYFEWVAPDWKDINNHDSSVVGFMKGEALSADAAANLDKFTAELAGGLNLWTGPLNLQDGTALLKEGEVATDVQVWYLEQLLEGMEGQSVAAN